MFTSVFSFEMARYANSIGDVRGCSVETKFYRFRTCSRSSNRGIEYEYRRNA